MSKYSPQFKHQVVSEYLNGNVTYTYLTQKYQISSSKQVQKWVQTLKKNKVFQSMSRKGNCLDNSPMENFFGILKQEMYYGKTFKTYEELKESIENYIYYYNHKRIKRKLASMSPVQYRIHTSQLAA